MNCSSKKMLNLLILGETGVGKSTWINGFANYLSFPTLDEAEAKNSISLIPTQFTMTDENYQETIISTGHDRNEKHEQGASSTQQPTSYKFQVGDTTINLIDTPGIGDTRGIEQDKKNWKSIMDHLLVYEELHAICILLKPNNARLTVMFQFCAKELLKNLHKDACKNILFCFTNCRSTFYRPGDTMPALAKLLQDNNDVGIGLKKDTVYCFDSEAVRYLAAVKTRVKFEDKVRCEFVISWEKSVEETERLIQHVETLQPYNVQGTLSINLARRMSENIAVVLVDVSTDIQKIIYENCNKPCLPCKCVSRNDVVKNCVDAFFLRTDFQTDMKEEFSAAACNLIRNRSVVALRVLVRILFAILLHVVCCYPKIEAFFKCCCGLGLGFLPECLLYKIANYLRNKKSCDWCENLQTSFSIGLGLPTARTFSCTWIVNCFIFVICLIVRFSHFFCLLVAKVIYNIVAFLWHWITGKSYERCACGRCSPANNNDEQSNLKIALKNEQKQILDASIRFAMFLRANSITPFFDHFEDKLFQVTQADSKRARTQQPRNHYETVAHMQKLLDDYRRGVRRMEEQMNASGMQPPTPADINEIVEQLYGMQLMGERIRTNMAERTSSSVKKTLVKIVEVVQRGMMKLYF